MIIVDFICWCALVPMCLCQGQPGPQPLLYFLSFRFKFVFAAVGQVLQQLATAACESGRVRESQQLKAKVVFFPFVPDAIKNSLSPSPLLSSSNSPVIASLFISQQRLLTSLAVPHHIFHVRCLSYRWLLSPSPRVYIQSSVGNTSFCVCLKSGLGGR